MCYPSRAWRWFLSFSFCLALTGPSPRISFNRSRTRELNGKQTFTAAAALHANLTCVVCVEEGKVQTYRYFQVNAQTAKERGGHAARADPQPGAHVRVPTCIHVYRPIQADAATSTYTLTETCINVMMIVYGGMGG